MKRQPTAEQKARAAERRAKFTAMVKQVAAMTDEQRAEILQRVGAILTCEGRALSPKNSCLLLLQLENVSMVGGFNQWIAAGRAVRKGEHGLSLWIPCQGKSESEDEPGETYFRLGTVFDLSQTDEIAQHQEEAA